MKRRTFIRMVGASALGLPFMHSQFKPASWKAGGAVTANNRRLPYHLEFSPEEEGVIATLRRRARSVCLVGGGVLARAGGQDLPYVNLVTDASEFGKVKHDLYAFGVQPISTPELPSHFIKFVYGDKPFTVLNMDLAAFLRQNVLSRQLRFVPLAHNFIVYSASEDWLLDPYGAHESRGPRGEGHRIKRLLEPESAVAGLELCLAVIFDAALLHLSPPVGHARFERRLLNSVVGEEREATVLFHQVLSFFPDLLEFRGLALARKYLVSPLCVSAGAKGPGIDLKRVDAALQQAARRGAEVSSPQLMLAINGEFQRLGEARGVGLGLPDYMAAKKLPIRRGDLMAEVLRSRPVAAA